MNLKNVNYRSLLLLQLVIVSLFMPIPVSSISIILFLLNSFTNRNFFSNIRYNPHQSWVWISMLYFGVNAASLLYTDNMTDGLRRLETMQAFIWVPFCIASIDYDFLRERKAVLINTFFFASVAAAIVAILVALYTISVTGSLYAPVVDDGVEVKEYYFTYLRLSRVIMHPGYLSVYIGISIYLGLGLLRNGMLWIRSRFAGYGLLIFLLIFLFMLQGRMNLLAFGAITFCGFIIYLFRKSRPARAISFGALIIAALVTLFLILPSDVTRRFTEFQSLKYQMDAPVIHQFNGVTLRLAEWHCAWDVIEDHIITGVGLGDAKDQLLQSYEQNRFVVGLRRQFNCHNQYLESWLGAGLPAFILLALFLVYLLLHAYRQKDGLLAMVALYFFLSMLTESMLIRHKAVTLFNVLLPILLLSGGHNEKDAVKETEE